MFEKIDLFSNINISKIKLDSIPWNAIIADKSLLYSAIADSIIKNTYRTLMTRGMKGCYVYCTDKGLQEHLKELQKYSSNTFTNTKK